MYRDHCDPSDVEETLETRAAWSLAHAAAMQAAIGLATFRSPRDARHAIERLVIATHYPPPDEATYPGARALVRGYALELASGLRLAAPSLARHAAAPLNTLCDALATATRLEAAIRTLAEAVLEALDSPDPALAHLADRVRRYLEAQIPAPLTLADIATAVRSSQKRVRRAFTEVHQVTVMAFYRQRCAERALEAVRQAEGLKNAVEVAGCSERTLRRRVQRLTGVTPRQARLGDIPVPAKPSRSSGREGTA